MQKPEVTEHKLTPGELSLISEYVSAIRDLEQQKQGALQLIVRANGLEGPWALTGDKLVKQKTPLGVGSKK